MYSQKSVSTPPTSRKDTATDVEILQVVDNGMAIHLSIHLSAPLSVRRPSYISCFVSPYSRHEFADNRPYVNDDGICQSAAEYPDGPWPMGTGQAEGEERHTPSFNLCYFQHSFFIMFCSIFSEFAPCVWFRNVVVCFETAVSWSVCVGRSHAVVGNV